MKKNNQIKLAWLAGIIDGEGAVFLIKEKNKPFVSASIQITNTNFPMIAEVRKILDFNDIEYRTYDDKAGLIKKHKLEKRVYIQKVNSVSRILELVKPYLVAKVLQGKLVSDFCKLRAKKSKLRSGNWEQETKIYNQLRTIHKKPTSSATYHE